MALMHAALALALLGLAQAAASDGEDNTAAPKPHLVYILSDNLCAPWLPFRSSPAPAAFSYYPAAAHSVHVVQRLGQRRLPPRPLARGAVEGSGHPQPR